MNGSYSGLGSYTAINNGTVVLTNQNNLANGNILINGIIVASGSSELSADYNANDTITFSGGVVANAFSTFSEIYYI